MLREQKSRGKTDPCLSLADFIAPRETGLKDHIGGFAVTTGIGENELAAYYEGENDDYSAIMVKALADRLAEGLAELMHAKIRKLWGYEKEEPSNQELIAEKYQGIRPAFGYPACPDHLPKTRLFDLLDAPSIGMKLTETCSMLPGASVSGLYFGHPRAQYFNVGRIDRDQVRDYAARMELSQVEVEKWLMSNLGYLPD